MRVLVLESEPGLADEVVDELNSSGHAVARCHDRDSAPFPCHGMEGHGQCPLDAEPVQVAIAIDGRLDASDTPPAAHDGARCALRRTIPLVIAGPTDSALAPWATETVKTFHPGVVVTVAEQAADAPLRRHQSAAADALRTVLEIHGFASDKATAEVVRANDALKVVLSPNVHDLSTQVREVASIRALAAVRAADPFAARIGVSVT